MSTRPVPLSAPYRPPVGAVTEGPVSPATTSSRTIARSLSVNTMISAVSSSVGTAPSALSLSLLPKSSALPKSAALSSVPLPELSATILERFASLEGINTEPTFQDTQEAERLAAIYRTKSNNSRRWSMSSKLSYKDSNAVLEQISLGRVPSATPSLVLALIKNGGADVCVSRMKSTNIIKSIQGRDQEDVRSQVLMNAARHCSDEIFHILARYADEMATQEAFPSAIAIGHPLKIIILMVRGADASSYCKEFLTAVSSGPEELVQTLLKDGGKGACQSCRDKGLVLAASLGHETKGSMLLNKGADPTFDNGSALIKATRRGLQLLAMQIASAIRTGPKRLHPASLDTVVGEAYALELYQLVELCLKVGATGNATNNVLIEAVRRQQTPLVEVLVQFGACISYDGGLPLQLAVQSGNPKLLAILLGGDPSQTAPGVIGEALMKTTMLGHVKTAISMMDMLLEANPHNDSVTEVLVQALNNQAALGDDHSRAYIAYLFCRKGRANVNVYDGISLTSSVANGWIETFRVLCKSQTSRRSLESALIPAVATSDPPLRNELLSIILEAESRETDGREGSILISAFTVAAGHHLLEVMQFLETKVGQIPDAALTHALMAATAPGKEKDWTQPQGLQVMAFLLERGATGQVVEDAFCRAVPTYSQEAIETLSQFVQVPTTFSRALCSFAESESTKWTLDENLWLVNSLLDWGCDANSVNVAIIAAVNACVNSGGSEAVVDLLLSQSSSANVNFQNGEALLYAVKGGKASLLELLLTSGEVERATVTQLFVTAITSSLEQDVLVRIVEILAEHRGSSNEKCGFDVHVTIDRGLPLIAACLEVNPEHAALINYLIRLGCDPEAQFQATLYGEERVGDENTSILLWACHQLKVSTLVIDELISAKANVNFTSSTSKTTPLLLASKSGRSDIVRKLLAAGAKITTEDALQFTALNWASRKGDLATAKTLIKAKTRPNDGSLHEAARELHCKVVAALLKAKHNVDFPCSKKVHNGRTALQELCLKSNGLIDRDGLYDTIQALHTERCNVFREHLGRNALFLALENVEDPFSVTENLLDIAMWQVINDERNIFSTNPSPSGTTICYSASMFLESEYYTNLGDSQNPLKLRDLLKSKGCIDRRYEVFGPGDPDKLQRIGAVGMPTRIQDVDAKRREKLQKRHDGYSSHSNNMQRKRDEAERNFFIKGRVHHQEIGQHRMAHQTKMIQMEERPSQKLDGNNWVQVQKAQQSNEFHRNGVHHNGETATQKL